MLTAIDKLKAFGLGYAGGLEALCKYFDWYGGKHMVDLTKPTSVAPGQFAVDSIEILRSEVANKIYDQYCDRAVRMELIRHAIADFGVEPTRAQVLIDMELDSLGFVNEYVLCNELNGLLHRFTDGDRKLSNKERQDAMQMVCKARPGLSKGLAFDVAERLITEFCRAHNVKVKVGLFSWAIP